MNAYIKANRALYLEAKQRFAYLSGKTDYFGGKEVEYWSREASLAAHLAILEALAATYALQVSYLQYLDGFARAIDLIYWCLSLIVISMKTVTSV